MGVSGSGKTTVGRLLAEDLGWPFFEGDDLHPPANVAKMSEGIQLTDEDRWPWLDKLKKLIGGLLAPRPFAAGRQGSSLRVLERRLRDDHK